MAFGDEENSFLARPVVLSPDTSHSVKDDLDSASGSPCVLMKSSDLRPVTSTEVEENGVVQVESVEIEGDLEEPDQTFSDHDVICRRLERSLGLTCLTDAERNMDDWTELASLISYHYAAQMDPAWIKSAGKQNISPSALLLCLIYMERLHLTNADFRHRNLMTSSDLFVVSLMSACKFLYDVGEVGDCYNGTWARHCKIPIKRLNKMEFDFLDALEWNLQSEAAEFDDMMDRVQTDIIRSNLRFHPSMTYSDLLVLANLSTGFSLEKLLESLASLVKIFAALTASYLLLGLVTLSVGIPITLGLSSGRGLQIPSHPTAHSSSGAVVSGPTTCTTPPSSTIVLCNESVPLLKQGSSLPLGPYRTSSSSFFSRDGRWSSAKPLSGMPVTGRGFGSVGRGHLAPLRYMAF